MNEEEMDNMDEFFDFELNYAPGKNIHDCELTYEQHRVGGFMLHHIVHDGCTGVMKKRKNRMMPKSTCIYKCSKCGTPLIFSE